MPDNWTPSEGAVAPGANSPNDWQNAGNSDPTATAAGTATADPTATAATPATSAPVHDANMTRSAARILERIGAESDAKSKKNCPNWDGVDPEIHLGPYLWSLRFWSKSTTVPEGLRGIELYNTLSPGSITRTEAESLTDDQIESPQDFDVIVERIKKRCEAYLELYLPRNIDKFFYGSERERGMNFTEYSTKKEAELNEMRARIGSLPDLLLRHVLLKFARLSETQKDTMAIHKMRAIPFGEAMEALRKLDRPESFKRTNKKSAYSGDRRQADDSGSEKSESTPSRSATDESNDEDATKSPASYYDENREYTEAEAIEIRAHAQAYGGGGGGGGGSR